MGRRGASLAVVVLTWLSACGGESGTSDTPRTTPVAPTTSTTPAATTLVGAGEESVTTARPGLPTTSLPDPREAVRTQIESMIGSYLASVVNQIPSATSQIDMTDLAQCVKERVGDIVDQARPMDGQPSEEFMSELMNRVQSGLFNLIGICAKPNS